jgi:hypothetical protein
MREDIMSNIEQRYREAAAYDIIQAATKLKKALEEPYEPELKPHADASVRLDIEPEDVPEPARPLIFRVRWYSYLGHSFVEAKDYDEAVNKANKCDDFGFYEVDDYSTHPEVCREDETDDFEPEDIEDMKKEEGA